MPFPEDIRAPRLIHWTHWARLSLSKQHLDRDEGDLSANGSDFARRSRDSIHTARHDTDSTVLSCLAGGVNRALETCDRQAGAAAAVLSRLVWLCELTAGRVRSASECVQRSHCAARHTPTQTRHRTHLSGCRADSVHTTTPDTRQSCPCRVWRGAVNSSFNSVFVR